MCVQYTSRNTESVLLPEAGMHWQGQSLLQNEGNTAPLVQITPCTQYMFTFPMMQEWRQYFDIIPTCFWKIASLHAFPSTFFFICKIIWTDRELV